MWTRRTALALSFLIPLVTRAGAADLAMAERDWLLAVGMHDSAAVARTLHTDARWTSADGRTLTAADIGKSVPVLLIGGDTKAERRTHVYAPLGIVQVDAGKRHELRVWIEQPSGWQLLVHQEVQSLDAAPTATPGAGADCDNPCKRVGIQPKNAAQAAVIAAYQELEIGAETRDVERWASRVGDEFVAASSNSDRLFDKATRIVGLRQSTMRGLSPTPLMSGTVYDFPAAAVMISEHVPDRGRPLHVTRVWVQRDGRWVETLSYQTAVR
jgi:hypothetical protein